MLSPFRCSFWALNMNPCLCCVVRGLHAKYNNFQMNKYVNWLFSQSPRYYKILFQNVDIFSWLLKYLYPKTFKCPALVQFHDWLKSCRMKWYLYGMNHKQYPLHAYINFTHSSLEHKNMTCSHISLPCIPVITLSKSSGSACQHSSFKSIIKKIFC